MESPLFSGYRSVPGVIAIFEGMQLQLFMEEDVLGPLDVVKLLIRMLRPTRVEREA